MSVLKRVIQGAVMLMILGTPSSEVTTSTVGWSGVCAPPGEEMGGCS